MFWTSGCLVRQRKSLSHINTHTCRETTAGDQRDGQTETQEARKRMMSKYKEKSAQSGSGLLGEQTERLVVIDWVTNAHFPL